MHGRGSRAKHTGGMLPNWSDPRFLTTMAKFHFPSL